MSIGNNIRRYRKYYQMLQKDLADKLNVSNATVSSWEIDRTEPNIGMIEDMCKIFKCKKSDLLDGNNPEEVINRITDSLTQLQGGKDDFWESAQKDQAFQQHIRFLFSLSAEDKQSIYRYIELAYYAQAKEKDEVLDA